MTFTDAQLTELQRLFHLHFGIHLSEEDALAEANRLMVLCHLAQDCSTSPPGIPPLSIPILLLFLTFSL